jgi:hypothetical protein
MSEGDAACARTPPCPDQAHALEAAIMTAHTTAHLPSAPNGNGPLTLIGAELQRQEEGLRLLQQLKAQLGKLTTSLHAVLDGHAEAAAPSLRPTTAAIYTTLLGLASLRQPQPDKARDAVYEIGTAVKSLDLKHLDDSHATADALTRIEGAGDRVDGLAAEFCYESSDSARADPLSKAVGALLGTPPAAPRSGDDALTLAKAVADGLRGTAGSIGTGHLLSAEA